MTVRLRTLVLAIVLLFGSGAGAAVLVLWLGVYDVSATTQHTSPVFKLLDYALRRAVQAGAEAPKAPADLDSVATVERGAVHYRAWCVQCHGAPGVGPHPLAFGLLPAPANLLHAGRSWTPTELHWVVRNGIKMSGMPAWAWRLSDEEIWEVVAFVRAMPRMAPAAYAALSARLPQPAERDRLKAPATRPGDAQIGRQATARYLCATCHTIPGLTAAPSHVGPPLEGIGTRSFIAGVAPNTRENMVRFLLDPQRVAPLSAMPSLGVTEQDAHDIAAYLATLDRVRSK